MTEHGCPTEQELDAMLEQFCQRIEDLHAEKLALCDLNDALAEENRKLRLELAGRIGTRRRFAGALRHMGRETAGEAES